MKITIAIDFYKNKNISVGYCAEIAGMTIEDFIVLLGKNYISIFSFETEKELKEEIENAKNSIIFKQAGKNYLSILRNHVLQKMQHEDARIYLFGSWARGNQRNSSDIDIAIEYKSGEGYSKVNELHESIEESSIPYWVDVVDMRRISGLFVEKIRKEGVVWKD